MDVFVNPHHIHPPWNDLQGKLIGHKITEGVDWKDEETYHHRQTEEDEI